jgi:dienelactone hydrolase
MIRRQGPILTLVACALVLLGAALPAAPAGAATLVNPVTEAQNLLVSQEREAQFDSPSMRVQVAAATSAYQEQRRAVTVTDPGRQPNPNSCTTVVACSIDPRLEHWAAHGGIVDSVLFTARSGATLSGHIWATKAGPAHRPAILIINGSVIGYEQGYWYAAQALARDGYVVLTFDAQGEGMSDQFGAAPDQQEGAYAGTPVLGPQLGGSGLPFYDGGEDALNFLLSTPKHPYVPVPSRTTGTSHAGKQAARVKAGLDPAYDPLWKLINRKEIGAAGHSYGAEAASWLGQSDPRIKAVVAWDNLCVPVWPSPTEVVALAQAQQNLQPLGFFGLADRLLRRPGRTDPAPARSGAWALERLPAHAGAVHGRPRPGPQGARVARLHESWRRHRRDRDPWRHPLRVRRRPDRCDPSQPSRHRSRHLVHARLVRPLPEGRGERRRAAAHHPLARRWDRWVGRPLA